MIATRILKSQYGMTMVELLIAIAVGSLVLGGTVIVFTKQQSLFKNQGDSNAIRALGRFGVQELTKDLRMAGFGLPANKAITAATDTSITYRSNTDNLATTAPSAINSGSSNITVTDATGFAAGQNVAVYYPFSNTTSDLKTISSVAGNVITLTSGTANAYSNTPNMVVGYHTIVYTYDSANTRVTKTVDGASNDLISNVTGLTFAYKDKTGAALATPVSAANLANIRRIDISLVLLDPQNVNATTTFNTQVNVRSMNQ